MARSSPGEGPFSVFFTKVFDYILLNLLFLVTSLPVFTAGASLSALTEMVIRVSSGEDPYVIRGYFGAFRRSFPQAVRLFIPFFAGLLFTGDLVLTLHLMANPPLSYLKFPLFAVFLVLLGAYLYVPPQTAVFENDTKTVFINAFRLAGKHLPVTLLFLCLVVLLPVPCLVNGIYLMLFLAFFLTMGFSLLTRLFWSYFQKIFIKEGADLH